MNHDAPGHVEEPSNEEIRSFGRRKALTLLGGIGLAGLGIYGATTATSALADPDSGADSAASTTTTSATSASTSTSTSTAGCSVLIPEETEGPYPLDLSSNEAMFRSDITEDKDGLPLTLNLTFVNANDNCAPLTGARVDIWHCDASGVYSGYVQQGGVDTTGETFLRGIQLTDDNGQVTFQTIYPGWYVGRVTHVHFQVFLSNNLVATSQLAFPTDVTTAVYGSVSPYTAHGQNTSVTSFAADNVFSDGTAYQMLSLTGNTTSGYTGTLTASVAA